MELNIRNSRLSVAHEGLIAFRDAQGTRLTAHSGAFWITNEGNSKDHILGPGQSMVIDAGGLTVITALHAGDITVLEPLPGNVSRDCARRDTPLQRWLCKLQRMIAAPAEAISA